MVTSIIGDQAAIASASMFGHAFATTHSAIARRSVSSVTTRAVRVPSPVMGTWRYWNWSGLAQMSAPLPDIPHRSV